MIGRNFFGISDGILSCLNYFQSASLYADRTGK